MSDEQDIKASAIRLLARREYSRAELESKLSAKFATEEVEQVLDALAEDGYQSDYRFADVFIRNRLSQGYGLKRIQFDMQQKRIASVLVEQVLDEQAPDWYELAADVWRRRFNQSPKGDYKLFGKQMRYLLQRGFSNDEARAAIDSSTEFD